MTFPRDLTGLLALTVFLCACGSPSPPRPAAYRFIDHLKDEHIVRTPLRGPAESRHSPDSPEAVIGRFPEPSVPLREIGIPENPLGLKRRLRLGGTERNVLFSPPGSEYAFVIDLDPDQVLEFGVGIVPDPHADSAPTAGISADSGTHFSIELESEGKRKTLFQKVLSEPEQAMDQDHVFSRQTVDIPYALPAARLSFITEGEGGAFSFWVNPVLYRKNAAAVHVILISIDTLRADHLGCYGYGRDTSPHVDALAAEGARFTQAYASSPWTLPSHVSLFTSQHGVHHQVYHDDERMDPALVTLAELFYARGFACAAFTGGGFVSPAYGFAKGFESYDVGVGGVFHQDSARRVAGAALDWIDRHSDRNSFLFIHTYQPHSPYACPPPHKVMFLDDDSLFGHADLFNLLGGKENLYRPLPDAERQNLIDLYDGEVRYVDDLLIGPLVSHLKDRGLYDRALLVFLSDHGEEFFDHGAWGHGQSLYDELLRVPLIIKFPHSTYAGMEPGTIVSLVDVMPTLVDEMGWEDPRLTLDGRSLLPILQGRENEDRRFLADIGSNVLGSHVPKKIATNREHTKLILNDSYSPQDLAFFRYAPPPVGRIELFDLTVDPRERSEASDSSIGLANEIIRWINDFYTGAKKAQTQKARIDQSVRDQLKALGYIR